MKQGYANHAETLRDVTDFIAAFDHNVCLHSSLENQPPAAFERKLATENLFSGVRK